MFHSLSLFRCAILLSLILTSFIIQTKSPISKLKEEIANYTRELGLEKQVKQMKIESLNVNFNSTREKYMFVYFPLVEKCALNFGLESHDIAKKLPKEEMNFKSIYYIMLGVISKILEKGMSSSTVSNLLKYLSLGFFAPSLPLVIGYAGREIIISLFNIFQENETNEKCIIAMVRIEDLIKHLEYREELNSLLKIKESLNFKEIIKNKSILDLQIIKIESFNENYQHYLQLSNKLNRKRESMEKFINNFIKIVL